MCQVYGSKWHFSNCQRLNFNFSLKSLCNFQATKCLAVMGQIETSVFVPEGCDGYSDSESDSALDSHAQILQYLVKFLTGMLRFCFDYLLFGVYFHSGYLQIRMWRL